DDYLGFGRKMKMMIYENKVIRNMCIFYCPLYSIVHGYFTYKNRRDINSLYNIIILLLYIHVDLTLIVIYRIHKDIITLDTMMERFWSIGSVTKKLEKHFRLLFLILDLVFYVAFLLSAGACIVGTIFKLHPDWKITTNENILIYIMFLIGFWIHTSLGYMIVFTHTYNFMYYCTHAYVQIHVFIEFLNKIVCHTEDPHEKNRIIKNAIICSCRQHYLLYRYASTLTLTFGKRGAAYLLISAVIICALGAYVIYAGRIMIAFGGILVQFFMQLICYAVTGDMFTTAYRDCADAIYNCKWYEWNIENCKLILQLLIFAQNEQIINPYPAEGSVGAGYDGLLL
ncbi:Odorant receptor Or67, partial [Rhyzopertha dominica]